MAENTTTDANSDQKPNSSDEAPESRSNGAGFQLKSLFSMGSAGNVGIREGVSYGLGLIVYIVALLFVTGALSGISAAFVIASGGVDNIAVTALIGLFGFAMLLLSSVLFFAGFAGLQYKIIADGVSRGNNVE